MDNFNPNLVCAANRSFGWIFHSFELFSKSPEQTIGSALAPYVIDGRCTLINPGLVLAAAYIYFLYPKEVTMERMNLNSLSTEAFELEEPISTEDLLRRLRNSLAHGRFDISDSGRFDFRDQRPNGSDPFRTCIGFEALGDFVEKFGRLAVGQPR